MANEKRLIDVNSLLLKIEEELSHESPFFTTEQNELIDIGLRIAAGDIRHQPTVDAVEVVHGRWIEEPFVWIDRMEAINRICSVCGWKNVLKNNYCPNCGAKMDGERKDNG